MEGSREVSGDVWAEADPYERYVGRWSRRVAAAFVPWLGVAPGGAWLDVGCGTGALTEAVAAGAGPRALVGVDPSSGFVVAARRRVPSATFLVGDAGALPLPDAAVDATVSGLVLNFVPDVAAALAEMRRVTVSGGTVGAYVWDYAGRMEVIRACWDAAVALDPEARARHEGVRFPLCREDALADAVTAAGLAGVTTRAVDVPAAFADFDDYWTPFLGGQGPAPGYVAGLAPAPRARLRDRLRGTLPRTADGTIRLLARAWAVRGTVP